MSRQSVFFLLLAVCISHALVHVFELALPSVEISLAEYYQTEKKTLGWIAMLWRMPWGFGAIIAGFLVDRYGARPLLTVYLLGCALTCAAVAMAPPLGFLMLFMFGMGAFACIYHPAGLALLSHEIAKEKLPRALGLHGVFGSIGIGAAPFFTAAIFTFGGTWKTLFWSLAICGIFGGSYFAKLSFQEDRDADPKSNDPENQIAKIHPSFYLLAFQSILLGFTYAGGTFVFAEIFISK